MTPTLFTLAQGGNNSSNPMQMMIMIGILFVVMWVVMIRPQQKRQKELKAKQDALKAGDQVVTIGGLHAPVNAVSDKTVTLRLADSVFVKYDRSAIATVITKDDEKSDK